MPNETLLQFDRRPSLYGLMRSLLRNRSPRRRPPENALAMCASWRGAQVEAAHLRAFQHRCGIEVYERAAILYPLCFTYPPMLRMLSGPAAPMPLFDALNSRMRLRQYAALAAGDTIDVDTRAVAIRRLDKGLEVDIQAQVARGSELVWEALMTFYYRARFDGPIDPPALDTLAMPVTDGVRDAWRIAAKRRFQFGLLCGDTNPLHYARLFAKALGFERDFAQPLLVLGDALNRIGQRCAPPDMLEIRLKAPVYYEREVNMLAGQDDQGSRFDIYCAPNAKPSICGRASTSSASSRFFDEQEPAHNP